MKKFLLRIWRIMPYWMQHLAGAIVRPRYQVAVAGIVLNEKNQLLLCEHTYLRDYRWGLPGGDLQFGEDPGEAVRREVREETGLIAGEVELLFVMSSIEYHQVSLVYLCRGVEGALLRTRKYHNVVTSILTPCLISAPRRDGWFAEPWLCLT